MSTDKVNVVIVGGGVIGCCTAYYLARAGARVTVLDRGALCSEASSANVGLVTISKREGLLLGLAQESLRLMTQAMQELETDFELMREGSLTLLRTEEELHQQQAFVQRQRQQGVDVQFLDQESTLRLEPAVSPDTLGAVYCPLDGAVNPYALTLTFASAAQRLGATFRTGAEVTGLKAEGGRVRAAFTREGEVAGDFVVVAAGAWSPFISRTIGLDLPVEPSRGQVVLTEASPPLIRMTVKDLGHVNVRRTNRGNYLMGSTPETVGFNKQVTLGWLRDYVREASHVVPSLVGTRILRAWAGLRPSTPDNRPILGPVGGYDGLILATGHSRMGIGLSTATSKMIADFITTGNTAVPLEPFRATRFASTDRKGGT